MAPQVLQILEIILAVGAACCSAAAAPPYRQQLCYSWRFNVEVNNLRGWTLVPDACESYVASYITGEGYESDSREALLQATSYAHTVFNSSSNASSSTFALNAWVFDVDETSLSNVAYYARHRFGAEAYNDTLFNEWVGEGAASALPATLDLFNTLKSLGFSVFFLTGRIEDQRNITVSNLSSVGYSDWDGLILRDSDYVGVVAEKYKSAKRKALEDLGYTIVGNVGDQWSDLTGYSLGSRVFKLPNPMYYIS